MTSILRAVRTATIAAGLLAPRIAGAQAAPDAELQRFVASPAYQANIGRLFAGLPPDVFQRCPALVSNGSIVRVTAPVGFGPDGRPVSGAWKQSFPVSGCGNDTTINLYFRPQPDGTVTALAGAPGDTRADLVLQRDAARYVLVAAAARARDCGAPHIRSTSYDGAASGGSPARQPWRETWTVAACGQVLPIAVTFTPDATGTTVVASAPPERR